MSLSLRVTVEVIDTATGSPVNERGYLPTSHASWRPLRAQIILRQYAQPQNAHASLNNTFAHIQTLREIMQ